MSKGYSREFKDCAVRMVGDCLSDDRSCTRWRAISEITPRLGISVESLRHCYEQSLIDTGQRPEITREEHKEIKRLKRENTELRRTNEILKLTSAFLPKNSTSPR